MNTIDSLHLTAAVSCLNIILICILFSHGNKITQAVKVTIHCFFFLHLRGTNHIAGNRLSIGKAGGYSKEQDKKKKKKNS